MASIIQTLVTFTKSKRDGTKADSAVCSLKKVVKSRRTHPVWMNKTWFFIQGLLGFIIPWLDDNNENPYCRHKNVKNQALSPCKDTEVIGSKYVWTTSAGSDPHDNVETEEKIHVISNFKIIDDNNNVYIVDAICQKYRRLGYSECTENLFDPTIVFIDPKKVPCKPALVYTNDVIKDPVDVTVLCVGGKDTVVVTDFYNRRLISFSSMYQEIRHSSLKLQERPWSVTQINHNRVAVSFFFHEEIAIVEVTADLQLTLQSCIDTPKLYRCLPSLDGSTLVAGSRSPPSIDILILDTRGQIQKIKTVLRNKIEGPEFLCTTNDGNILVSNGFHSSSKSVYCLTPEGEVIFNYSPTGDRALKWPRGITTTDTGDVFVADDSNKVIQLTSTGYFVREVLTSMDGISLPHGICFHKDKLHVVEVGKSLKMFQC